MLIKIWKSVDIFTGWVEALPTWSEEAVDICKSCLIELIPWFGPPKSFQSDYRPSFIAKITQRFTEALELDYKLHTFWHPESKTNHILKKTLAKLCQEMDKPWTTLFPIALLKFHLPPKTGDTVHLKGLFFYNWHSTGWGHEPGPEIYH